MGQSQLHFNYSPVGFLTKQWRNCQAFLDGSALTSDVLRPACQQFAPAHYEIRASISPLDRSTDGIAEHRLGYFVWCVCSFRYPVAQT